MRKDNILTADEGMIYTNGNAYGYKVDIGIGDSEDNWYKIPVEEYNSMMESEEATAEDYINALERLGAQ